MAVFTLPGSCGLDVHTVVSPYEQSDPEGSPDRCLDALVPLDSFDLRGASHSVEVHDGGLSSSEFDGVTTRSIR